MKSITIKKLYKLHSWVGLVTGILLFVIAFSGSVAVFEKELKIWSNNELRTPITLSSEDYEKLISSYAERVGDEYLDEVDFNIYRSRNSNHIELTFEGHFELENGDEEHKGIVFELDPVTFKLINKTDTDTFYEQSKYNMASFIADFHADLHLGRPIGLILTGLLGLTLMVSIITGIFVHRKILAQLFTFRPMRTFSLLLADGHKVMSVWGVLFHSTIAFTGAFLGLATVIIVPAAAYVSFNGDQDKLIETFTSIKPPIISNIKKPTQVATILEHSFKEKKDLNITSVSILGYNDQNALVYVFGSGDDNLGSQQLVYNGATADFIKQEANFGRLEGVTGDILDAMYPLHFGNFGGVFVKFIWSILGLSTALLPITGLMLWIERGINSVTPAHHKNTYHLFNRLLIGSCGGIVVATSILFPAQLLLNYAYPSSIHNIPIFITFFSVWLISILLSLFFNKKYTLPTISYLTILFLFSTMPIDAVLNNSHLFNMFETKHFVSVGVNLFVFSLSLFLFFIFHKINKKNHVDKQLLQEAFA